MKITKEQYYKLYALFALAQDHHQKVEGYIKEIENESPELVDYITDGLYGYDYISFDDVVKHYNIEVEE